MNAFPFARHPRPAIASRWLIAVGLLLLLPVIAAAQSAATGTISGSVSSEATRKNLERALIAVAGTNLSTFSEADGSFRITGVPAGAQTLQAPRYTLSLAGRNVTEENEGQHFFDGRSTRTGTGGGTALTLSLAARF